jgi:hypothetical protein
MYNIKVEEFKNKLVDTINSSNLDLATAYYVMKDCYRDLEDLYKDTLTKEQQQQLAQKPTETHTVTQTIPLSDIPKEEE